jgi:hypothetical protein
MRLTTVTTSTRSGTTLVATIVQEGMIRAALPAAATTTTGVQA